MVNVHRQRISYDRLFALNIFVLAIALLISAIALSSALESWKWQGLA